MSTRARLLILASLLLGPALPSARPAGASAVTVTDRGDSGAPGQLRTLIASNDGGAGGDLIRVPACPIPLAPAASPDRARGRGPAPQGEDPCA